MCYDLSAAIGGRTERCVQRGNMVNSEEKTVIKMVIALIVTHSRASGCDRGVRWRLLRLRLLLLGATLLLVPWKHVEAALTKIRWESGSLV